MRKKNLIIFFSKLSIGGMEKALVDFIRKSNLRKNYNITLYVGYVIEKSYQDEISKYVNVKVIWPYKWNFLGKVYTYFKMMIDKIRLKNKYDCAICYTHHHKILADMTINASSNNICFIHNDLCEVFNAEELIKKVKYDRFSKIVCVSNRVKDSFLKKHPNYNGKIVVANNYIDGQSIIEKSKDEVLDIDFSKTTLINIARHQEPPKRITRIIEAVKLLKEEKYQFQILLIGDGVDHQKYIDMVNEYNLNDYIIFAGSVLNPYKYLSKSNALILSSQYEGYGIVLDEARILNVPIITTDVADASYITKDGYGILCENSMDGVYKGIKEFLDKGYQSKGFDYIKFNNNITNKIDEIVKEK